MRRLLAALAAALLFLTTATLGGQAAPAASAAWSPVAVTLTSVGATATVDLSLNGAQNLGGYELDLGFDPAVVAIDKVEGLATTPGRTWASLPVSSDPNVTFVTLQSGLISFGAYSYGDQTQGSNGNVPLARVTVRAVGSGVTSLHIARFLAADVNAQTTTPTLADAPVTVTFSNQVVVSGRVTTPVRPDSGGIRVQTDNATTFTLPDGSFTILTTPGPHTLTASHSGHLSSSKDMTIGASGVVQAGSTTLVAGNANTDDAIDLFDLTLVAGQYDKTVPPGNPQADINEDLRINLTDLVLVAGNYGATGPTPWAAAAEAASSKSATDEPERVTRRGPLLSVVAPNSVAAGEVFEAKVRVSGARDLAGVDLGLSFDPDALEALSVEPSPQDAGGYFDSARLLVVRNAVDAAAGQARYAAVTMGTDTTAVRQGNLVTLRFRALRDGAPAIRIAAAQLVNRSGQDLVDVTAR